MVILEEGWKVGKWYVIDVIASNRVTLQICSKSFFSGATRSISKNTHLSSKKGGNKSTRVASSFCVYSFGIYQLICCIRLFTTYFWQSLLVVIYSPQNIKQPPKTSFRLEKPECVQVKPVDGIVGHVGTLELVIPRSLHHFYCTSCHCIES